MQAVLATKDLTSVSAEAVREMLEQMGIKAGLDPDGRAPAPEVDEGSPWGAGYGLV